MSVVADRPSTCHTKRIPKVSSMVFRAFSEMSFIRRASTLRALRSTLHPLALPVACLNGIYLGFRRWGESRSREVGRGGSEGSVQVPRCQSDYEEYGSEDGELERGVVAGSLDREDQAGYERHRERDPPVEAARFGV